MKTNKDLIALIKQVEKMSLPVNGKLFAGANLIITSDEDRQGHPEDIIVLSEAPETLSWLVFQLKELFGEEISYANKHSFYSGIGKLYQKAAEDGLSIREQMQYVLHHINNMEHIDNFNVDFDDGNQV